MDLCFYSEANNSVITVILQVLPVRNLGGAILLYAKESKKIRKLIVTIFVYCETKEEFDPLSQTIYYLVQKPLLTITEVKRFLHFTRFVHTAAGIGAHSSKHFFLELSLSNRLLAPSEGLYWIKV